MSSDVQKLASFRAEFHENPNRSISEEYFQWKLLKNPYLKGHIYLETKDGKVIGSASITPKKISVLGETVLAGEFCDAFTAADYRRKGVFSRGMQAGIDYALKNEIQILYGTPSYGSPSSLGFQSKLNCRVCPSASLRYMSKSLRPMKPFLKLTLNALMKKKTRSSKRFDTLKKQVFNNYTFETSAVCKQSVTVYSADSINDEFDGIWGHKQYAFCTVRDQTYLNWRFFENPDSYILLIAKSGNQYMGYLAAKISRDKKKAVICDYITRDDDMNVFRLLLAEIENVLNKCKVYQIITYCIHNSNYFRVLEENFYFDHGLERSFSTVLFCGTELGRRLYSAKQTWHFTLADTDNI